MKKSEKENNLEEYRDVIDAIDHKIIDLLHDRFKTCKKIGQYKKENNTPIKQKKREGEILENRTKRATRKGINKEFIEVLFQLITDYSRAIQKEQEGL